MRENKGQVLIEMAVLLPLLFLLIFGMIDFSRAMFTKNTLGNAARSGARAAAVTPSLSPASPSPLFLAAGEPAQSIKSSLPEGLPTDQTLQYQVEILDSSGNAITGSVRTGNQVRVSLVYPNFPMITPFHTVLELIANAQPHVPGSVSVAAQATMRYE